jgi:Spy/CpxP family protein refolding chaperone
MKHRIWIALFALTCLVSQAHASDSSNSPGPILVHAQYMLTLARRNVFEGTMGLTDEQKDAFWNVYADYDRQRAGLTDQSVQLLRSYALNYDTLTNAQAAKMLDEAAGIAAKQVKLRRKYADRLSKQLGGRIGARFYEIDDYLNTGARLQLLDHLPFVGDQQ